MTTEPTAVVYATAEVLLDPVVRSQLLAAGSTGVVWQTDERDRPECWPCAVLRLATIAALRRVSGAAENPIGVAQFGPVECGSPAHGPAPGPWERLTEALRATGG
ncbi:MAG: hypothetical protein S0880_10400 [Actinomycetota bacterium]|nr:hypothetical protein [Actinomycetota bacterium]